MIKLVSEPHNNITRDPGQWLLTVDEEREFLRRAAEDPNQFVLVAELNVQIVGAANISRFAKPTQRHAASLGLSVDIDRRHQGIGTALMHALLDWAKSRKIRRIELQVFTRNTLAIHLYQKLGFVQEGLHRMAFLKQGQWIDEYTMALLLPE